MSAKARHAALLPVWGLVGTAWLAAVLSFSAVHASRIGCMASPFADLVAVGGIAGLGVAAASLVLVAAVPENRSAVRAAAAFAPLAVSVYAVVALLARNGAICG
jgi:hypothetical protein